MAATEALNILESRTAVNEPSNMAAGSVDRALMRQLASGDRAAMQTLVEQHGAMLNRLIGRLTAWREDQDDILQEVLLAIWQDAAKYDGRGSLEGWIRKIAVNRCRNHFRARDTFRRLIGLFIQRGAVREYCENAELLQIENTEQTRAALQELNAQDRSVLVLFYLEELTGDEIADLTNVKVDTVHVQLHRARQRLRAYLEAKQ